MKQDNNLEDNNMNSLGILVSHITAAKELGKNVDSTTKCLTVWCELYGINPEDYDPISCEMRVLKCLMKLDDHIVGILEDKAINQKAREQLAPVLQRFRRGMSPNYLDGKWHVVAGEYFRDNDISFIDMVADMSDKTESKVPEADIVELTDLCNELISGIEANKIISTLTKQELIKRIKSIVLAIQVADLYGVDGVIEANNELVGLIVMSPEIRKELENDEASDTEEDDSSSISQKLKSLAIKSASVFNKSTGTAKNIAYWGNKVLDILGSNAA